jgi:hypothetical protein
METARWFIPTVWNGKKIEKKQPGIIKAYRKAKYSVYGKRWAGVLQARLLWHVTVKEPRAFSSSTFTMTLS